MCDLLRPTVFNVVCQYAKKLGFDQPNIVVSEGSKNGDSYSGEVYQITIENSIQKPNLNDINENNDELINNNNNNNFNKNNLLENYNTNPSKVISLIAKIPPKNKLRRQMYNSARHFEREQYVYENILPAFEQFQRHHLSNEIFQNYPKIYAASSELEDEYIILEDLRAHSFKNAERTKPLDFKMCKLVLENLSKFHAISFALKDQQPQLFEELSSKLTEILFVEPINESFDVFLKRNVQYSLTTLDQSCAAGQEVAKRIESFGQIYGQFMAECCQEKEDAVVLHGDCWISNMMFKDMANKTIEMKFLDWQVSRYGTVAIDLSYFLFCCTDAELRLRLPELLEIYHQSLTQRINELGSNGTAIFPFEKCMWHMKKYSRFGLGMALMTLHATCCNSTDLVDVQSALDETDFTNLEDLALPLLKNPVYKKRMSGVCEDFVRLGYL